MSRRVDGLGKRSFVCSSSRRLTIRLDIKQRDGVNEWLGSHDLRNQAVFGPSICLLLRYIPGLYICL